MSVTGARCCADRLATSPLRTVVLQDGQERVSRKQAHLFIKQGKIIIEDLQSANGTYVRAVRASGCRVLRLWAVLFHYLCKPTLRVTPARR